MPLGDTLVVVVRGDVRKREEGARTRGVGDGVYLSATKSEPLWVSRSSLSLSPRVVLASLDSWKKSRRSKHREESSTGG